MEGLVGPDPVGARGGELRHRSGGGRIAAAGLNLNPVVGGYDLGASGLNALKAVASRYYPSARNVPNLPDCFRRGGISGGRHAFDLSNASPVQRYAEAAATGLVNPRQAVRTGLEMVGATGGGDIGSSIASYYGGPDWSQFGRWLGSFGGAGVASKMNPATALSGSQAPGVSQSAANISTPENPVQPTYGSMANPVGRGIERGLSVVPGVNIPIVRAQQRMEQGIKQANDAAAAKLNPGAPTAATPYAIGSNLIQAARTKSAAIKADAGQQFENLYNQLPAGNSTLVDATPVLNAIKAQANSPNVSGQQKADLMDRYNYLKSMTYGQPGYNGPRFQGVTPVNAVPIGQIAKFRSELGDDLNTMRGLDATAQGPARDAVTTAMQNTFNQANLGPQFTAANTNYSRNIGPGTPTEILDSIGGKPIKGKPGLYQGGMDQGAAFAYLNSNLHSPSSLEPLVDPNNPNWRAAAAGFVGGLGSKSGEFRANDYGAQVGDGSTGAGPRAGISDPVLEQLTRGQPDVAQTIRDAANLGRNASPIGHVGGGSVAGAIGAEIGMDYFGGHLPPAVLPLALTAAGFGAQSRPFTSAMASGSTPLTDALYTVAPAAYSLNNPDDPSNQPAYALRPPSPLDALKAAAAAIGAGATKNGRRTHFEPNARRRTEARRQGQARLVAASRSREPPPPRSTATTTRTWKSARPRRRRSCGSSASFWAAR